MRCNTKSLPLYDKSNTICSNNLQVRCRYPKRDWTLYRDYYYKLFEHLGQQAKFKQVKFRIKSKIFLLDSSTISLCLSLFDWAKYKTAKGAVKMHTLLDYDGNLPVYMNLTNGKVADNKGALDIPLIKGNVVVVDRFYNDFDLLNVGIASKLILLSGIKLTLNTLKSKNLNCQRIDMSMF